MRRWNYLTVRTAAMILLLLAQLAAVGFLVRQSPRVAAAYALLVLADAALLYLLILRPYLRLRAVTRGALQQQQISRLQKLRILLSPETAWLSELLQQRYSKNELLKTEIRQSEILALQNQINPHFLYNTLEAIRSDALLCGADTIAKTTESLATFFRYTISSLDRVVTLAEEMQNIDDYFVIQRYRFGDKLRLAVHYEGDAKQYQKLYLPKLTLQPIVENAVYHGLEPQEELGRVDILVGRSEKNLLIRIADNGAGMDGEQLLRVNQSLQDPLPDDQPGKRHSGIALKNVHHRIQLLFGEEYGLHILSAPGLGTEVRIVLPVNREGRVMDGEGGDPPY